MAFCSNCGTEVAAGAGFCPKCGTSVTGGAAAGGAAGSGAPGSAAPGGGSAASSGLTRNMAGALCYVVGLITGIIFLVLEPYNKDPFIKFHAFQSIAFNVAMIVVITAVSLVPFIGWVVAPLLGLGSLIVWVILMLKAYQGATFKLPVLGDFAEKQASQ